MISDTIKLNKVKDTEPNNWLDAALISESIADANKRREAMYRSYHLRMRSKF